MAYLLRTKKTYSTVDRAEFALKQAMNLDSLIDVRYLIAATHENPTRYAPVLVGAQYIAFATLGNITVVN